MPQEIRSAKTVRGLIRWWGKTRSLTIRSGYGAGLKLNMRNASGDYAEGTNETPVQEALARYLKSGDVFYDIGANIGFFTVIAARLVGPSGRVYAFEPVPDNAKGIRRNAQLNNLQNITVFEKAVSKSAGKADLLLTRHPGGAKLSTVGTPLNSEMKGVVAVDVVCIDDLVTSKRLPPPSVVKVDVEGAELDVLCGMSKTVQQFKPVVICEIDHKDKEGFTRGDQELTDLLCALDYGITPLEDAYPHIRWHVKHVVAVPN
jgi:FkbM family methyltransferase